MDCLIVSHVATPRTRDPERAMRVDGEKSPAVKAPCIEAQTLMPSASQLGAVVAIRPLQYSLLLALGPSQSEM